MVPDNTAPFGGKGCAANFNRSEAYQREGGAEEATLVPTGGSLQFGYYHASEQPSRDPCRSVTTCPASLRLKQLVLPRRTRQASSHQGLQRTGRSTEGGEATLGSAVLFRGTERDISLMVVAPDGLPFHVNPPDYWDLHPACRVRCPRCFRGFRRAPAQLPTLQQVRRLRRKRASQEPSPDT